MEHFPDVAYLIIPSASSESRRYVPIGFVSPPTLASNLVLVVNGAKLYHFGILSSTMHMAWMRSVAGRLKSDYRYSASLVYNNFPWPSPTEKQRAEIEQSGQGVLDAREPFLAAGSTLADLYDPRSMPPVLAKAHTKLDKAVDVAYRSKAFSDERERVGWLFGLWGELVKVGS